MNEFRIFRALGLSFKAWFVNFIPFTLIAAVLYAPAIWWSATIDFNQARSAEELLAWSFFYPLVALTALATLVAPAITYRVIQNLNGTKVSIWTSIRFGLRGILPAVILAVIQFLVGMIPIPLVNSIASIILACIFFVATPAAVGEQIGPFAALSRSSFLTSGRRWGIFGMLFLLGMVPVVAVIIWLVPILQAGIESPSQLRIPTLVLLCFIALYNLFIGIVEAVSYALLRQDKEGVSNAELARIFD